MEDTTKDILKYIKNKHTKVELKEEFKGNYYSYLTDTIYIAKDFKEQKAPKAVQNINKKAAELIVVCHECIHSVQSKCMHILNTIFSNLSIIFCVICILWELFGACPLTVDIIASGVIFASIIVRLILEVGAINGSMKLAADVVSKNIIADVSDVDIQESIKYMNKMKYLALLQMVADKIMFLILILVIK